MNNRVVMNHFYFLARQEKFKMIVYTQAKLSDHLHNGNGFSLHLGVLLSEVCHRVKQFMYFFKKTKTHLFIWPFNPIRPTIYAIFKWEFCAHKLPIDRQTVCYFIGVWNKFTTFHKTLFCHSAKHFQKCYCRRLHKNFHDPLSLLLSTLGQFHHILKTCRFWRQWIYAHFAKSWTLLIVMCTGSVGCNGETE